MLSLIKKIQIIKKVKEKNLSYLNIKDLFNLYTQVHKTNKLDGIIIETGCALGGSSIIIAKAKAKRKKLHIYDVFEMIPPPSDNDGKDVKNRYNIIKSGKSKGIGGNIYYGYKENLLSEVKKNFFECGIEIDENIKFIKGLYQETLNISEPVSFAHIDCDWYESVKLCLCRIMPNLINGGKVIVDDYNDWSGCKKAVDEYFLNIENKHNYKLTLKRKLLIEKA